MLMTIHRSKSKPQIEFQYGGRRFLKQTLLLGAHTGAALLENNEASAKLTTANGGTFTSSSARLSSQSRYSTLDR